PRQVAAEERDRSGIGPELAGDEVEERRLAGAVRPDDEASLARLDDEVDGVGDAQAAERFGEAAHGEGRPRRPSTGRDAAVGLGRKRAAAHRKSRAEPGTRPSGMKMTMTTKIAPSSMFQRST